MPRLASKVLCLSVDGKPKSFRSIPDNLAFALSGRHADAILINIISADYSTSGNYLRRSKTYHANVGGSGFKRNADVEMSSVRRLATLNFTSLITGAKAGSGRRQVGPLQRGRLDVVGLRLPI